MLLKEKYKWRGGEKEEVSSYWIALRKWKATGIWKSKQQITFSGELALEEGVERRLGGGGGGDVWQYGNCGNTCTY